MAERGRSSQRKRSGSSRSSASSKRSSSRSSASRSRSSAARSAAARKGGRARARQQKARKGARTTARAATRPAARLDLSAKSVAELRETLRKNLIRPFDLVMLTRDRIEEVVDEAVERGRLTADDAQKLATQLIRRGRKQTDDVLSDLEQLLNRGPGAGARRAGGDALRSARKQVETATRGARSRAMRAADPALAQADRARRAAGVGPNFPITAYDDLTAAQVQTRLGGLRPAELRKVRDYERRHANRKSVLGAVEQKLS